MSGGGSKVDPYHQKDGPTTKGETKKKQKSKKKKKLSSEEVCRLFFAKGLSQAQIAKKLGVTPKEISDVFAKLGIEAQKYSKRDLEIGRLYYASKLSKMDIAKKLGISYSTVRKTFDKYGWKSIPRARKGDPEEARRLYEKGLTQEEIGKRMGLSRHQVGNYLRELGVVIRKRGYNSDREREKARKEKSLRHQNKVKDLRDEMFGSTCRICGVGREKRKIAIHRKDCQKHDEKELWTLKGLRKLDPEDWAALCVMCHRGAHWTNDDLSIDYEKLAKMAQQGKQQDDNKTNSKDEESLENKLEEEEARVAATKAAQEMRSNIFGDDCFFCGEIPEDKRLVIHRKDGNPHEQGDTWDIEKLQNLKRDEWAPVCNKHHRYVHWAMDWAYMTWEDIESAFLGNRETTDDGDSN